MDKILLKPTLSDATYYGRFADLAFEPLANPIPVYKTLLKYLSKYGATLKDVKIDTTTLSEANISCHMLDLHTMITWRLDRIQANFFKLQEIGEETARTILLDSCRAVSEVDPSIEFAEHEVLIQSLTKIEGPSYDTVMRRYINTQTAPGEKVHAGVVSYSASDPAKGQNRGSLVLDRWVGQEQGLLLKVSVVFDAKKVPIDSLPQRIDDYLTEQLDQLGLRLDRGQPG